MDRFLIFLADHNSHFTISPFANLAKGSSGCHSHNGMHQGIAGSKAYCFAGEIFISENLNKMQTGKILEILDIHYLFQNAWNACWNRTWLQRKNLGQNLGHPALIPE
jgi:hypothetical protein